ncbi:MAG: hypothetical protein ACNI3A_18425 [Desulfovibrio sp.]|uniref:hypothetical protein n=1 Tax=Desulfovibrio sp. 7SRBS1 TaxID=3378064 RepID=UPI003B419553
MKNIHLIALSLALLALLCTACVASNAAPDSADALAVHSDAEHSFTMKFPADFTVTTDPKQLAQRSYFPLADGTLRLGGYYSGKEYAGTNLHSASIVVSVVPAKEQENDCARFEGDLFCGPDQEIRDATISGVQFKYTTLSDAAAGQRVDTREYWRIHNGLRYEISLCLTYSDIGMYTPGEIKEFNQNECWARLTGILNTFSFSSSTARSAS